MRFHLDPLSADDTANYINHRLRLAAIDAPLVFSRAVTDAIHTRTRGVPRMINVVCDAILLTGYSEEQKNITLTLTQTVFEDLERMGLHGPAHRTVPRGLQRPRRGERPATGRARRRVARRHAVGHADACQGRAKMTMAWIFWASAAVVLYVYLGYPVLLLARGAACGRSRCTCTPPSRRCR